MKTFVGIFFVTFLGLVSASPINRLSLVQKRGIFDSGYGSSGHKSWQSIPFLASAGSSSGSSSKHKDQHDSYSSGYTIHHNLDNNYHSDHNVPISYQHTSFDNHIFPTSYDTAYDTSYESDHDFNSYKFPETSAFDTSDPSYFSEHSDYSKPSIEGLDTSASAYLSSESDHNDIHQLSHLTTIDGLDTSAPGYLSANDHSTNDLSQYNILKSSDSESEYKNFGGDLSNFSPHAGLLKLSDKSFGYLLNPTHSKYTSYHH